MSVLIAVVEAWGRLQRRMAMMMMTMMMMVVVQMGMVSSVAGKDLPSVVSLMLA